MTTQPPQKARRKRRADGLATRQRVLQVAARLFASGGYEATSLRQIAAASQIDIATLKYHFDDKPALFAQVYQAGHEQFLQALAPILVEIEQAQTRADVRQVVHSIVTIMQRFVSDHLDFVRLVLFRLLEDNAEIIDLEEDLQTVAIGLIDERFQGLIARDVIAPIDARAFVAFLISSFSMWQVTSRVKGSWLGPPSVETRAGKERSQRFFITALERMLGVEELSSPSNDPPTPPHP